MGWIRYSTQDGIGGLVTEGCRAGSTALAFRRLNYPRREMLAGFPQICCTELTHVADPYVIEESLYTSGVVSTTLLFGLNNVSECELLQMLLHNVIREALFE